MTMSPAMSFCRNCLFISQGKYVNKNALKSEKFAFLKRLAKALSKLHCKLHIILPTKIINEHEQSTKTTVGPGNEFCLQ